MIYTEDRVRQLLSEYGLPRLVPHPSHETLDILDAEAKIDTSGGVYPLRNFNGILSRGNPVGKRITLHETYLEAQTERYYFWLGRGK